ncbi:MAG: LysE family translocator [Brevibacterium yomogidense]|uniref:LysE family translocator n=1 Tax=Brevibacterium sp. Mu109 TaxID=1255669 RepID=UPI000C4DC5F6|nr:LysE family translocator [Brevibacterium sp. Mu109]SMX76519.1 Threonine/homoserine/homoserine lactone efflux protein [Brevibacterium sp. Mu109]
MTGAEFIAFLGASVILAVTPGPDTFLTLRFAARSVRAGLVYTAAAGLGVLVWAVLALTGVAALLERFPDVRTGLTWVGGSYLVFLGVTALLQVNRARRGSAAHAPAGEPRLPARSLPMVFRTGLISSLTNPKTGLFFLALLPPFLPASPSAVDHVLLVATVVGCMLVYGAGLSVIAGRVGRYLTGGSGPLIVDGVAGAILVVLGVSLVVL